MSSDQSYLELAEDDKRRDLSKHESLSTLTGEPTAYAGSGVLRQRFSALLDLTIEAVKQRDVSPLVKRAEKIARERFVSSYDLSEVQTAFNVLEETVWKMILKEMQPEDYAEALGLTSTALGAGKDAQVRVNISLASKTKAPSLDLRWTFEGTDALGESW